MSNQGYAFETLALEYLLAQGLRFEARNVRCAWGELDLVMRDNEQDLLVLVEVKYRRHRAFGGAAASVTHAKQQKLQRTALWYLQSTGWLGSVRFDVVTLEGESPYQITWITNAFIQQDD